MLQIVYPQTFKSICLLIFVIEYYPVEASRKTVRSSVDGKALGLLPEFLLPYLSLKFKKLFTTILDIPIFFAILNPDNETATICPFSNSVNLFSFGIIIKHTETSNNYLFQIFLGSYSKA